MFTQLEHIDIRNVVLNLIIEIIRSNDRANNHIGTKQVRKIVKLIEDYETWNEDKKQDNLKVKLENEHYRFKLQILELLELLCETEVGVKDEKQRIVMECL